jgi:glyoxylase-like metal-dependent hydrolase (beta-lactamase superfamily II)
MVDATIDVLDRGRIRMDRAFALEGHTVATASNPDPDHELDDAPVYNLVVDHPEATVLWDTGSHPDAGHGHWPEGLYEAFCHHDAHDHDLESDLEAAGWSLDDIDLVVQTHLHIDHAGGLEHFAGTDVPVVVHERELKHAYYSAKTPAGVGDGGYVAGDFDHDLRWRVVHGDRERLLTDLELPCLPGHTPGVLGMLVHLDDGSLLFASDTLEVRANYESAVPMAGPLLWDKAAWRESRRRVRRLAAEHDARVIFGHDADQFPDIADGWG